MRLWLAHPEVENPPPKMPDASTADITLRRLQQFKVKPGTTYAWRLVATARWSRRRDYSRCGKPADRSTGDGDDRCRGTVGSAVEAVTAARFRDYNEHDAWS